MPRSFPVVTRTSLSLLAEAHGPRLPSAETAGARTTAAPGESELPPLLPDPGLPPGVREASQLTDAALLQGVFEVSVDYLYIKDAQRRFIGCNGRFARRLGAASPQALVGRREEEFLSPEWSGTSQADDLSVLAGGSGVYEREESVQWPDGAVEVVLTTKIPWRDAGGQVNGVVGRLRDITVQRTLEQQCQHAQRLEMMGIISSGFAHDLGNVLAPILMLAPVLRERITEPRTAEMLDVVNESAQRGANIVRHLLSAGRGEVGAPVVLQVQGLLRELASMMRETFPAGIAVQVDADEPLWTVVGRGGELYRVLMNLCVNAREAMRSGGNLTLTARNLVLDAAEAKAGAGRHVRVSVGDTGPGIPREDVEKIFAPFYSTKQNGTGIGLYTALVIVKAHGGFIDVETEPGTGTTFHVHLPAGPAA